MVRDEEVQYEQDRLGNERKKLDTLRAQSGMVDGTEEGIVHVGSADTGSTLIAFSLPTNVDKAIVRTVEGFNSVGSGDNTMSLYSLSLDSNGNISSSQRRSVPIEVQSSNTRKHDYDGKPFTQAIGISAEFEGYVGVSIIADHEEDTEGNLSI